MTSYRSYSLLAPAVVAVLCAFAPGSRADTIAAARATDVLSTTVGSTTAANAADAAAAANTSTTAGDASAAKAGAALALRAVTMTTEAAPAAAVATALPAPDAAHAAPAVADTKTAAPLALQPVATLDPKPANAVAQPSAATLPAPGTPAAPATANPEALLNGALPNAQTAATPDPAAEDPKDLWDRIRRGFRMPDLTGPLVDRTEKFYASKPEYVGRMTERASRYLYHIVGEIERRNMPTEIALLPFIESAFNPEAMSKAKASGMWQFIPGTGKTYGLKQNMFLDERRDVLESTRAALDYLSKLHDMFGDWQLALAAYNWGEGAVQRAITQNQKRGKPTNYESLKMPGETRLYVPKLQAVKNIIANPKQFNLALPPVENEEYFTTITKNRDIDIDTAARFAGMSVDEFRALNPSFNKPVIVGATMPQLVLPKDKAEQFLANLDFAQGSLSSYTAYKMESKDTLDSVAAQFHTTTARLRDINGVPAGARLRAGATLLVPKPAGVEGDIPADVAENATLLYEPTRTVKRVAVKVRKGESLASLAKRQRVTTTQLAQWNGFSPSVRLQSGQTVFIERTVSASPKRAGATSRTASTRKHSTRTRHAAAGRPGRANTARR